MARILFSFEGGSGHYEPLLPLAQAAVAAGHTVAFACSRGRAPAIGRAGFTALLAGRDIGSTPETAEMEARYLSLPTLDERESLILREGFAGWYARYKAADLLPLCAAWRPDLLVREEVDYGAVVAAERLGLPHATVLILAAGSFARPDLIAAPLASLRAAHGLPPDPALVMLSRYLTLSPFPPSFRDPAFPPPATTHALRPLTRPQSEDERLPAWAESLDELGAAPTVYFTLGTAVSGRSGDVFARVIAGLRDLPINLIVTVGRSLDPASLGPQPPHVHIERFIPQAALLPHCDLVVTHGGSGTVMGALAHGLPLGLIPLAADQPLNAARCEAVGVGRIIGGADLTPAMARDGVAALLATPSYRAAASRLRAEIAALPEPSYAVSLLERLARERRPLVAM